MDVFEEAWSIYGDEASKLLIQYRPKFSKIVRQWTSNEDQFEQMYSDVIVWRLPRIIEVWDPTKGDMMAYIFATLRWYCFKYSKRANKLSLPSLGEIDVAGPSEEVSFLLEELDPEDAWLLENKYIKGFTNIELADALDTTAAVVRRRCRLAIENAKEILSD